MYILYLSQKMRNIYKLKLSESTPDEKENQFPLMNWYVKPEIINRKKYILFLERQNYFWGEIVDYWFMVNYSWIFYLVIPKRIVFIPGCLDFIETSLIILFLKTGEFYSFMDVLPFVSFPKWLGALTLFFLVAAKLLKRRAQA